MTKPLRAPRSPESAATRAALAWLHGARFLVTASRLDQLPVSEMPEIAFVSRTPGRTQHINLFEVGPKEAPDAWLADLPGYGYAAVDRAAKLRWQEVMAQYLVVRRNLHGVVQMVDSRLGFTDLDRQLLALIAPRVATGEVRLLVLLTKADKLNRREADAALAAAQAVLGELASEQADIGVALFSALSRQGLGDAAEALRAWVPSRAPAAPPA
jgi:GTP-binding protein